MATRSRSKAKKDKTTKVIDREEEQVDEKLVEEAVTFIRTTLDETLRKGVSEVGAYVLDKFFGGDAEQAKSKDPYKNASFRSLAERCGTVELPISKSTLHRMVAVTIMTRLLPEGGKAFKQLPASHQGVLLPLSDPTKVEKLAERAVDKELSVRDLRNEVSKELAKTVKEGERRGRPPTPRIVKTLNRSLKLFTLESGRRSFTKAMVEELDEEETKKALKAAEGLIESLKDLVGKLKTKAKA
jgi:hypothetical protein